MSMKYSLETTEVYDKWFRKLKDRLHKIKILARLNRVENGNFGDFKQINSTLYELRLFFGPGFRIYYSIKGGRIVLLLAGGDKSSQQKDINNASELLSQMEE